MLLHGPSDGVRSWTDFFLDTRKRWHECDPPAKPPGRRARYVVVGIISAALAITLHFAGWGLLTTIIPTGRGSGSGAPSHRSSHAPVPRVPEHREPPVR